GVLDGLAAHRRRHARAVTAHPGVFTPACSTAARRGSERPVIPQRVRGHEQLATSRPHREARDHERVDHSHNADLQVQDEDETPTRPVLTTSPSVKHQSTLQLGADAEDVCTIHAAALPSTPPRHGVVVPGVLHAHA
ncbi:hypothetical protein, partial [Kineococcus auxinigenes]|uniref:hypothetical protein n=1 Tax=unclassified Kineococcus TaxID=2621656 RepID=UPI003D7DC8D7